MRYFKTATILLWTNIVLKCLIITTKRHHRAIYSDTYSKTAATPLSAVYEIVSVSPNDEGSYTCQATNAVGIAEERIQIRIEDDNDVDEPCTGDRGDIPCPPDDRQQPRPDHVRIPESRPPTSTSNKTHFHLEM